MTNTDTQPEHDLKVIELRNGIKIKERKKTAKLSGMLDLI